MLKKVSKIAVLLCLIAFAGSTFAQNENEAFPRYGFWSNWSLGGAAMYTKDVNSSWNFTQHSNIGFELRATKQLNWNWRMRLIANAPAVFATADEGNMDRYGLGLLGFSWNFAKHFYLFADGGFAVNRMYEKYGHTALAADMGLGLNFDVCKHSTIFAEIGLDCVGDISISFLPDNFFTKIGWMYNFGLTAADRALLDQRNYVNQEALDACNSQVEAANKELANANENIKKLENQVKDLNNENDKIKKDAEARTKHISDSLTGIIDQLKSDQMTYYAMPFSVLFANNEYRVNDTEMVKVQAVARILKDNPDVKLTLVGFCDNTGSDAYNMKLSQRRAEAVKRLLVKRYGIAEDRLTVDYKGKTVAFGDLKYAVNRRVSFYRVIE